MKRSPRLALRELYSDDDSPNSESELEPSDDISSLKILIEDIEKVETIYRKSEALMTNSLLSAMIKDFLALHRKTKKNLKEAYDNILIERAGLN